MWDLILLTDTTVGEVETLARDIAIRVCGIISAQPGVMKSIRDGWDEKD
jgi:hypothetical protein